VFGVHVHVHMRCLGPLAPSASTEAGSLGIRCEQNDSNANINHLNQSEEHKKNDINLRLVFNYLHDMIFLYLRLCAT
jgi:hypothetical protein